MAFITGWKSPGTIESAPPGDGTWSNPMNAQESDDVYAYTTIPYESVGRTLRCTNFDFLEVPDGATLLWIEMRLERYCQWMSQFRDHTIILRKSSGQVGDNKAAYYWPPGSDGNEYQVYGGVDVWNSGLTIADIKDSGTGVDVRAENIASDGYGYIDHIQMRAGYEAASGAPLYFMGGLEIVIGEKNYLFSNPRIRAWQWKYLLSNPIVAARIFRYLRSGPEIVIEGERYLFSNPTVIDRGTGYIVSTVTMVPRIPKPMYGAWFQRISSVKKEVT